MDVIEYERLPNFSLRHNKQKHLFDVLHCTLND